jgi:DNA-binding transcriptional MerR regulator
MSSVEELLEQRKEIEEQIRQARKQERKDDLRKVRDLCRKHGFTYPMIKSALAAGRPRRKA